MTSVWVTRAEPGAQATAARLRERGLDPLVAPLLETRVLRQPPPDMEGVAALGFTSANGVRAFADLSPIRDLPVFAVGAATARAAREAGFGQVAASAGDVGALAVFIVAQWPGPRGLVLNPGAAEPAGDLVGDLAAFGVGARRLDVYETAEIEPSPEQLRLAMAAHFVLVHSPRAAKVLGRLLRPDGAPTLHALCLSPAVAAALHGTPLGGVTAAAEPDEADLLALLEAQANRR